VIPTTTRHLFVMAVRGDGFVLERDYDLTGAVPLGDKVISVLPDWSGRYWFASTKGVMGTVDSASGAVRSLPLGEDISNSFAVDDSGGVYVVTQKAMYRQDAGGDGMPAVTWRVEYENSGIAKPGQAHAASGTTPTVMEDGRVAIADNADPMNVVVYRRAREPVVAAIVGRDRSKVRRAGFYLARKRVARDRRAPFRKRVSLRHRGRAHGHHVSARVRMKDGRRVTLRKRYRACGERRR
jgi:hypothetical protein